MTENSAMKKNESYPISKAHSHEEIKTRLIPVFNQYKVKRAVLFGSYANGLANDKSDADILVESGLRGLRFISLYEDVRRALGMAVDLLDITHIETNSKIEREILETGVVIYEK